MSAGSAQLPRLPLGVVTGLADEARIVERRFPEALVACAGADAARARAAAQRLSEQGARSLLSFGVAGGLQPGLAAGALILAEGVVFEERSWACDPDWRAAWSNPEVRAGWIAGTTGEIVTAAAKSALRQESGALAADMESHAVAAVAAERGLPFLALRAVADPAERDLPRAVRGAIDELGRSRGGRVAARLLLRPWELPALLALARDYVQALKSLERACERLDGKG